MIVRLLARCIRPQVAAFLPILLFIVIVVVSQFDDIFMVTRSLIQIQSSPKIVYPEDFDCSRNCSDLESPISNITLISFGECPSYFKWIHEDLKPWKEAGVTKEMMEKAAKLGQLRIVIVKGKLYFEKKGRVFQTRDIVTIWGILQLLRLYSGRVPDLEMAMNCNDRTSVKRKDYGSDASGFSVPPPLFHYCSDQESLDIVFPDWSFWGWPEINIKPWEELQEELEVGNARIKWMDREPFAYWKGNPGLGSARNKLITCNATKEHDWNARIFDMDWKMEKRQGFSNSDLSSQCSHRYKIYAEGNSWSVSQKYILFCDSMTLFIKPQFYDFFSRSLVPTIHYWPIEYNNMCDSIRFAVEWGNNHPEKAEEIGKAGSKFVKTNLRMKYIYDYMFHLMNEYSKLMKYKPRVPKETTETCSETLICSDIGRKRRFKKHSMVKSSSNYSPCELPSPYDDDQLRAFVDRKEALRKLVLTMEENRRMPV